ncbi:MULTISPECIES: hypothetical protein [Sphingomonas]|jgi:hypothetical protein|nr:hypothetical protein [Sphingomonas turrisvirgatae]
MSKRPDWRARVQALEYALIAILLLGSFMAGALGFVRWLIDTL